MWNWVVDKLKPAHPLNRELGSARARQRFIATLPTHPPEAALKAVTQVFEAAGDLGLKPDVRLQALCELDEFAQPWRQALFGRLIENSPKQTLSDELWNSLVQHCTAWAAGYETALAALGGDGAASEQHAQRILVACRTMRALAKLNMLLHMRYREVPGGFWTRVESLLGTSRSRAQPSAALTLYADEAQETSLLREYLVLLLFEVAPLSNLLPGQIHAVDLVLRRHSEQYTLTESFDASVTPFAIDPDAGVRPLRWLDGLPPKPGMRFFGLGGAYERIRSEREQAKSSRTLSAWLAPSQLSCERYSEMLERVATQWGLKPPARAQRRDAETGELLVAHDFAQIRKLVTFSHLARSGQCSEYDRSGVTLVHGSVPRRGEKSSQDCKSADAVTPEEALSNLEALERKLEQDPIETWTLLNSSVDGLGAEVVAKGSWVKVGTLVAYRRPERSEWSLAVVRWLVRGGDERMRVGLRKLAGVAFSARVHINDPRQPKGRHGEAPTLHYDAIELDANPSCLLLAPGVYDPSWRYTLSVGRRWDFVRMQRCIECGLDFEMVEFKVVAAEQAA
jgi:hypothetical protein